MVACSLWPHDTLRLLPVCRPLPRIIEYRQRGLVLDQPTLLKGSPPPVNHAIIKNAFARQRRKPSTRCNLLLRLCVLDSVLLGIGSRCCSIVALRHKLLVILLVNGLIKRSSRLSGSRPAAAAVWAPPPTYCAANARAALLHPGRSIAERIARLDPTHRRQRRLHTTKGIHLLRHGA